MVFGLDRSRPPIKLGTAGGPFRMHLVSNPFSGQLANGNTVRLKRRASRLAAASVVTHSIPLHARQHVCTRCCCAGSPRSTSKKKPKALTHCCIHRKWWLVATDIRRARLPPSVVVDGDDTWRRRCDHPRRIPTDRIGDKAFIYSKTCQLGSDHHRTVALGPWLPLVVQRPRRPSDIASVGGWSPSNQVGMGIKPKTQTRP